MAEVIAVANQKGGVGKTTTVVNLAAALALHGQETLLIDMDPQANATSGLGFDKKTIKPTIYPVLMELEPIEAAIKPTNFEFLDAICATQDLIGAELELVSALARETRLRKALDSVSQQYSFIFIDCPPSLGLLTINALAASNTVIVPIQCEYYALEGLASFVNTLNRIRLAINQNLALDGAVFTMYDTRISLGQQVRTEVERFFKGRTFSTTIPRNVRLAEAPGFGQTIQQYDPRSRGAEAYSALAKEFLARRGFQAKEILDNGNQHVPAAETLQLAGGEKKP